MDGRPCVATIGFFDGVHRGHRFLIDCVKRLARERGLEAVIITFPVHPRMVMQPGFRMPLLSTPEEKRRLLGEQGVDCVVELPFTLELSRLTAREFMVEALQRRLCVDTLVIGYDHRFGHNRSEGFEDYCRYGGEIGMRVVRAEVYREIMAAIDELPRECGRAFRLTCVDGLSNEEAAAELGVSVNTVKVQKNRAKIQLRQRLKGLYPLLLLFCDAL